MDTYTDDEFDFNVSRQGLKSFARKCMSGFVAVTLALSLVMPLTLAVAEPIASAHNGEDHSADAAHAKEDLADRPVTAIESQTAAKKAQITRQTGVVPGTARTQAVAGQPSTLAAAAPANPGASGAWSPVINTPVVPIFQAQLPNGKLLIWDSVGDKAAESYQTHNFTRAAVWDPSNNTSRRVDVQGYNIFCAGFAHLPNGNILVAGGNGNANLAGIVQTHIFNWQTETWSRGPNMASARWYPSVSSLANGDQAILGGGPATPEVYQANNTIRPLSYLTSGVYGQRLYPFMISRPDTQLSTMGPYNAMYTVTMSGDGIVTGHANRDGKFREYGSFATYDIGKSLIVGGGHFDEGGLKHVPTRTSVIVNNNTGLNPTTTATGSMSVGRRQHSLTVLADGSVLATGGLNSSAAGVDLTNAVTSAERWDPATGIWTVLSSASRIRQYHSTASLLPDGRVITGGGGICGGCLEAGYLERNVEYFTPPYLYKKDGSGQLAPRPVISAAPAAVGINTNFTVTSDQAANISKVALIGLSDSTHGVDQGQRYVPLQFTKSGTTLNVAGPATGGIAPPGYYMLVIVDSAGVPSVAKMVQVAKGANPLMSPVKSTGAASRCLDVPYSSLAAKTYAWSYTCNGSKAQAFTRFTNDSTLRALGNCLDVPNSSFVSGQKVWMYGCNGSNAQKWRFDNDGTIRPVAKPELCLTAGSSAQGAAVGLVTCNNTPSPLQKWSW